MVTGLKWLLGSLEIPPACYVKCGSLAAGYKRLPITQLALFIFAADIGH